MGHLVARALDVLELLAGQPNGLPLTTICAKHKLPKVTAHRILSVMVQRGFVEQEASTDHYRLTLKTTAIGFQFLAETHITDLCLPILDNVAMKTGELARLAIADGDSLTWVAKSQGAISGLKYDPNMGHPVVLHATAVGRAWLATLPEDKAIRIVLARGFAVPAWFNRCTVNNEAELRTALESTRRRGYGIAREEGEVGTVAIGCPVFDPFDKDRAVATVSVAGPIVRISPNRVKSIVADLKKAAAALSELWPMRQFAMGESRAARTEVAHHGGALKSVRSKDQKVHQQSTERRKRWDQSSSRSSQ
jgi:DNA-binding IclR family transcriptional regulator